MALCSSLRLLDNLNAPHEGVARAQTVSRPLDARCACAHSRQQADGIFVAAELYPCVFLCVCVRARLRACVRACVRMRVHARARWLACVRDFFSGIHCGG